ncbi:MAG: NAD-dependent epimerase/dehydratase family protein [Chloroflexota bacterium]|nr:NAD-dependent epimerase/dehydratase family protein [Chloroflexota bacterium]
MNRRILVTGGAGFIGSAVVDELLARGDEPHVVDDLSKGQIINLPERVPLQVLDIAASPLDKLFSAGHFDAVVHCAAQTNVMRSLADPALDYRINVVGAERMLHAAAAAGTPRFVFISSGGAAYGETPTPATETTRPNPDNPYGRHKLEGEASVARAALSTISLRLSNVYGARQRSDGEGGVISIFADRLAAGLPLEIYGDGEQQRDFIDVSDVVSAILLAIDAPSMTGLWNVGTGDATSVNRVADLMLAAFGARSVVHYQPDRPEIRRSCLDVSKLTATGRWAPAVDLPNGIGRLARAMPASKR